MPTNNGSTIIGAVADSGAPERKKTKNSGTVTSSTASRNSRFEVVLAKNTTARSTGASRMPSRQPDSVSCEKLRLRPSRLVNTISAHSRPPEKETTCSLSPTCANAAPYTVSTKSEYTTIEVSISRVRNSCRTSLPNRARYWANAEGLEVEGLAGASEARGAPTAPALTAAPRATTAPCAPASPRRRLSRFSSIYAIQVAECPAVHVGLLGAHHDRALRQDEGMGA